MLYKICKYIKTIAKQKQFSINLQFKIATFKPIGTSNPSSQCNLYKWGHYKWGNFGSYSFISIQMNLY